MLQESSCRDFGSRVFLNNATPALCAKPRSVDASSSVLMGVLRPCPKILPSRAAPASIAEAWQDAWRCVALPAVVQTQSSNPHHLSGEEQGTHSGELYGKSVQTVAVVVVASLLFLAMSYFLFLIIPYFFLAYSLLLPSFL